MTEQRGNENALWTPANIVTIVRILLVPVFVVAMLSPWPDYFPNWEDIDLYKPWVAALIFAILSCTDALDGYLARSRGEVTNFGKFIDPLADKILVAAALLALIELQVLPSWAALIIIVREFIVSGLRMLAAAQGVVIAASWYGKAKTVFQIIAILLFIVKDSDLILRIHVDLGWTLYIVSWLFMLIALALTIVSMVDYFVKCAPLLGFGANKKNKQPEAFFISHSQPQASQSAQDNQPQSLQNDQLPASQLLQNSQSQTSQLSQDGRLQASYSESSHTVVSNQVKGTTASQAKDAASHQGEPVSGDRATNTASDHKDAAGLGMLVGADTYARAERVVALAKAQGLHVATAESCTGGLIGGALTAIPGSSAVVEGGIISYSNEVKQQVLGVSSDDLARVGAVSSEVAAAMAQGSLRVTGCDLAVAVTGIAGPGGATADKPVGTVWFGVATAQGTSTEVQYFSGSRAQVRTATVDHALSLLEAALSQH